MLLWHWCMYTILMGMTRNTKINIVFVKQLIKLLTAVNSLIPLTGIKGRNYHTKGCMLTCNALRLLF